MSRSATIAVGAGGLATALVFAGSAQNTSFVPLRTVAAAQWYELQPGTTGSTVILVGGASDPTGGQQAGRVLRPTADRVLVVYQPGVVGIGGGGLPAIGSDGTGITDSTYADTVDVGAANTVAAIGAAGDQPVYVYTLSQGADEAAVAARRYESDPTSSIPVALVIDGSPSFPETGVWQNIVTGIPGLPAYGPADTTDLTHTQTTSICVVGDPACGMGNILVDPVGAAVYAVPGFLMHGSWYNSENLAEYQGAMPATPDPSDSDALVPITPGAATPASDGVPVGAPTQETRPDGTVVTVQQYSDGSTTRTWRDGSTTYIAIDTGQNPWGLIARSAGIPVPRQFDQAMSSVVPVPQPGEADYAGTPWGAQVKMPTVHDVQRTLLPGSIAPQPGGSQEGVSPSGGTRSAGSAAQAARQASQTSQTSESSATGGAKEAKDAEPAGREVASGGTSGGDAAEPDGDAGAHRATRPGLTAVQHIIDRVTGGTRGSAERTSSGDDAGEGVSHAGSGGSTGTGSGGATGTGSGHTSDGSSGGGGDSGGTGAGGRGSTHGGAGAS
ncbi:PE-PPE domain-containing protein [Tsukamurella sp. 8F]|uniref:PE-PPE domain-containing protein n=1 Tax=unclassified Tsukamurella TaxID=2633480 RepID=UPI0023B92480|nr:MULTISPECIES: PE-PPE domain-containing protein [unclassified Tsukamurella]MDF0530693.1 PE-PPE domain-containing protein [Tsukamurella sp. 8J]MDF0587894.1 PE-PPE domain-containing protein [Tsukamurella sp. 8F]